MDKLGIYAIEDENSIIANFCNGYDEKLVSSFLVKSLNNIRKGLIEIEDPSKLGEFLDRVRKSKIVRVGYIDLETHELISDYNILVNLFDFGKDEKNEI